jgi:hypothetical protein
MRDGEPTVATPRLGIAKGIIAILLGVEGFLLMFAVGIGLLLLSAESPADFVGKYVPGAFLVGLAIFGLCLWRGSVAIRNRKVRRVTRLNFGLWLGFLIIPFVGFVIFPLGIIVLVIMFPSGWEFLSRWWPLIIGAVVAVVITCIYLRKTTGFRASRQLNDRREQ